MDADTSPSSYSEPNCSMFVTWHNEGISELKKSLLLAKGAFDDALFSWSGWFNGQHSFHKGYWSEEEESHLVMKIF